jgi:adenine-specific DNA-methyltransferase
LIACITDASKLATTNPPFTFAEPRRFTSTDGRILAEIRSLNDATDQLRRLSRPFLNWAGKAERLSFEVPTLPLFVHERLSTKAIVETLRSHRKDAAQATMFDLFGDPQRPLADAITKAYEHQDKWVNRLILGDSLVVMNSLLHYEGLGGQVQMIYIDPPYGVSFGSNFQPFVRKRDVAHNDDEDMTREPEMVKAYRDTWELGIHSYLAYLRDRLLLARDLLHATGSLFVQISDENLHHVRELMDEIFGEENFVSVISFVKTSGLNSPDARLSKLATNNDFLIWYARDVDRLKFRQVYGNKVAGIDDLGTFNWIELSDGTRRPLTKAERNGETPFPNGRLFARADLTAQKPTTVYDFAYEGKTYNPLPRGWRTTEQGMRRLAELRRIFVAENSLRFVQYLDDFSVQPYSSFWSDTGTGSFTDDKIYVVQTPVKAIQRCMLMTTDPGDLVLDPTCGGGTTAYVAELLGRRWITIDTSRVPSALTRQRLLTATYPYFELRDEARGPIGGFVYKRKQNKKGEEIGGVVPHVTLKSIANNEPPQEELLVDRPEEAKAIVRVTGPLCVEATIPTPLDLDGDGSPDDGSTTDERVSFLDRMLDTLRRAPILQVGAGRSVTLKSIRQPAKTLALSAEAVVDVTAEGQKATLADAVIEADERNKLSLPLSQRPVAIVFGPENGSVSERLVYEAATEATAKKYTHLYVIGFAIQPNAEALVAQCDEAIGIPATWVPVTPDVVMGDLLRTTRASQIFSVAGRPEIELKKVPPENKGDAPRWQVTLNGLDTFDPVTMEVDKLQGDDVPCWMLDSDYNGRVFHATQVFFPRTEAWDSLKTALRVSHEESVWDHLAGATSAPFEAGEHRTVAVKVIDDRGNELMVVKAVDGAR